MSESMNSIGSQHVACDFSFTTRTGITYDIFVINEDPLNLQCIRNSRVIELIKDCEGYINIRNKRNSKWRKVWHKVYMNSNRDFESLMTEYERWKISNILLKEGNDEDK